LLLFVPAHGISANTEEDPPVEESPEQPAIEESAEQSQYEETAEDPYQSYEEPAGEYYEEPSGEQPIEETVEEYTEEVTEEVTEEQTAEPGEEVYTELETAEEPAEVTINHEEAETFSITGEVVEGDTGMEDITVILSGDGEKEAGTDENAGVSITKMPPGDYELQMEVPDGYTAEKETMPLNVEDRSKQGITFLMEETPAEESVETDDQVMADQDGGSSNNLTVIL